MPTLTWYAAFYDDAAPAALAAGLTVTYTVYKIGTGSVDSGSATETAAPGVYTAAYVAADSADYVCVFATAATAVAAAEVAVYDPLVRYGVPVAGGYALTVTAQTAAPAAIPGAGLTVFDSGGNRYTAATADGSGTAVFSLPAGDYTVRGNLAGYSWADTEVTVSGDGAATVTGTVLAIELPVDPDVCRLYAYLRYPDNSIPAAAAVTDYTLTVTAEPDGAAVDYFNSKRTGVYDAVTGLVYWDAPRGATVNVSVLKFFTVSDLVVPDAASYNLPAGVYA